MAVGLAALDITMPKVSTNAVIEDSHTQIFPEIIEVDRLEILVVIESKPFALLSWLIR